MLNRGVSYYRFRSGGGRLVVHFLTEQTGGLFLVESFVGNGFVASSSRAIQQSNNKKLSQDKYSNKKTGRGIVELNRIPFTSLINIYTCRLFHGQPTGSTTKTLPPKNYPYNSKPL